MSAFESSNASTKVLAILSVSDTPVTTKLLSEYTQLTTNEVGSILQTLTDQGKVEEDEGEFGAAYNINPSVSLDPEVEAQLPEMVRTVRAIKRGNIRNIYGTISIMICS